MGGPGGGGISDKGGVEDDNSYPNVENLICDVGHGDCVILFLKTG